MPCLNQGIYINWSINQTIKQSINQSINQSIIANIGLKIASDKDDDDVFLLNKFFPASF